MSETPENVLELAFETLDDFERCKEAGTSIRTQYNRLYYASFYAAKAALLAVGEEPKTHRGTANRVFQVLFQERSMIERDTAATLSVIQTKRDLADYDIQFTDTTADLEAIEREARELIDALVKIVRSNHREERT